MKLNLALHVRARREDGYHAIESLFAFCADGDGLTAAPSDDGTLTLAVTGPFADAVGSGEDNLVLRAARALRDVAGIGDGATLTLDKRLPVAAGIGGGSADAAAALRLLVRMWDIRPAQIDLYTVARMLGADVPACLSSRTMFGTGIGERLTPVEADEDMSGTPVLLVNPRVPCATAPVFRAWDGADRGPLTPQAWRTGRNDLQEAATMLVPEIAAVLDVLAGLAGAGVVRMSGSGATCFALFTDAAARDAGHRAIAAVRPGWWTMASTLR